VETEPRKSEEEYLINELAAQAGVTVRTIRYYTDEGLLPPPETRGKYACYNRSHLLRLELIRRMKEAYLPLREIRQVIIRLSDEEVSRRLREFEQDQAQKPTQVAETKRDALDYIARVRGQQAHLRAPERDSGGFLPTLPPAVQPPGMPVGKIIILDDDLPGMPWRRIQIADGIELNLREPLDPAVQAAIERFIKEVRQSQRKRGG